MSKNQLVICYSVCDGGAFFADIQRPFDYESKEKAEYDLLLAWQEEHENCEYMPEIEFAGMKIDLNDFTRYKEDKKHKKSVREYVEPVILTLSEWWEANKPNPRKT